MDCLSQRTSELELRQIVLSCDARQPIHGSSLDNPILQLLLFFFLPFPVALANGVMSRIPQEVAEFLLQLL